MPGTSAQAGPIALRASMFPSRWLNLKCVKFAVASVHQRFFLLVRGESTSIGVNSCRASLTRAETCSASRVGFLSGQKLAIQRALKVSGHSAIAWRVARYLMKWYAAGAGMLRRPRTTKAILEEVMLSAPLPPLGEDSLAHNDEACRCCDDVRSISMEDLVRSVDDVSRRSTSVDRRTGQA